VAAGPCTTPDTSALAVKETSATSHMLTRLTVLQDQKQLNYCMLLHLDDAALAVVEAAVAGAVPRLLMRVPGDLRPHTRALSMALAARTAAHAIRPSLHDQAGSTTTAAQNVPHTGDEAYAYSVRTGVKNPAYHTAQVGAGGCHLVQVAVVITVHRRLQRALQHARRSSGPCPQSSCQHVATSTGM
jgi:hypothetical protein